MRMTGWVELHSDWRLFLFPLESGGLSQEWGGEALTVPCMPSAWNFINYERIKSNWWDLFKM